jgi:hypothetical protein
MTIHRKYEHRTWRPQWYFILNTYCVNSYLIWKNELPGQGNRQHRRFREELSLILRNWPYEKEDINRSRKAPLSIPNWEANKHIWKSYSKRGYYCWCKKHTEEWIPKQPRRPLGEIVNEETKPKRARQSQIPGGCHGYGVYLCRKGDCFEAFHSYNNTK